MADPSPKLILTHSDGNTTALNSTSLGMATGSGKPGGFPGRVGRIRVEGWPFSRPVPGGKGLDHLDLVFTRDVYANYSAPLGILNGTVTLAATLQHLLGTCVVPFLGKDDARTVTYFQASHFGRGLLNGQRGVGTEQVLYAYGAYDDSWVKVGKDWRVRQRSLVYYDLWNQ
ncbi:hypothetical protein C8R44DRAFT_736536 [Mycena epipterygia]|nr:hypothetical protein C8R44DRAFT_736536 [Mycena epipterygia]